MLSKINLHSKTTGSYVVAGKVGSGSRGSSKPGDLMRSATDWVPW